MKKEKNMVMILLCMVMLTLLICCIVLTIRVVDLNTKVNDKESVDNNVQVQENEEIVQSEQVQQARYYQNYNEVLPEGATEVAWKSREIELNTDSSARFYIGGNTSGGAYYKGTYVENDKTVTLTLTLETENGVCDNTNSVFQCSIILSLDKTSSYLIERTENQSITYSSIGEETLKLLK